MEVLILVAGTGGLQLLLSNTRPFKKISGRFCCKIDMILINAKRSETF